VVERITKRLLDVANALHDAGVHQLVEVLEVFDLLVQELEFADQLSVLRSKLWDIGALQHPHEVIFIRLRELQDLEDAVMHVAERGSVVRERAEQVRGHTICFVAIGLGGRMFVDQVAHQRFGGLERQAFFHRVTDGDRRNREVQQGQPATQQLDRVLNARRLALRRHGFFRKRYRMP